MEIKYKTKRQDVYLNIPRAEEINRINGFCIVSESNVVLDITYLVKSSTMPMLIF